MEWSDLTETFETVAEMTDASSGLVPLSPELVSEITAGDDDPKFATYIIESGWSKSKRFWSPELFGKVVSEINSAVTSEPIVGYQGHIPLEQDAYLFPDIQLQWVGAKLLQTGNTAKMAAKAYFLPGTKGREYAKRGLARTVSWRGKAGQVPYEKGVKITDFQIESIDLARPRSAGMSAKMVGALTSEMETEGGNSVKPEEIQALQENELRAHNPALASAIETNAKKPLEDKISEMQTEAAKAKPALDLIPGLKKLLHLGDDVDEIGVLSAAISHLKAEGKSLRESVLDSVLAKRLKGGSDADRALVRRVLVGEMVNREFTLTGEKEKDEKIVSEMVTEIIDADESLKVTVSEMEAAPPAPPTTQNMPGTAEAWKPGMSTANVTVKARA